jgi:hypothetical protein
MVGESIAEMARMARTIQEAEELTQAERDFNEVDREDAYYDHDDPDSPASIQEEARRELEEQGYYESIGEARDEYRASGLSFEAWLETLAPAGQREFAADNRDMIEPEEVFER